MAARRYRANITDMISTRRRVKPAPPPAWIKPQLAKLVEKAPDGPDWLHEIKFDGYRMHARLDAGRVQNLTRRGYDDGNGGHCLVGALLHLSRKHRLPRAPAIALQQDAMPRPGVPLVHFNDACCGSVAELRSRHHPRCRLSRPICRA